MRKFQHTKQANASCRPDQPAHTKTYLAEFMDNLEEDEMAKRGTGYKSSDCLCCNSTNSNQAQLPG